jgi:ATP/maltotriose-dependent transcriptional regulator MalT
MIVTAAEMAMRRALREAAPLAKVRLNDQQTAILARACARIPATSRPPVDARGTAATRPKPTAVRPLVALSTGDLRVLRMLAAGRENSEIAFEMHVSEHGVKTRLVRIYGVLKARNRAQAVALGYELGLLGSVAEDAAGVSG